MSAGSKAPKLMRRALVGILEFIVTKSHNTDINTVRLWCNPATNQVRDYANETRAA